mmetsp:Transcript_43865/g.171497  ORF Transcript_43865/g.171497 Transcript_43865/m.171497 type:complete len:191 (-) Transcript_43865:696-1268(-)
MPRGRQECSERARHKCHFEGCGKSFYRSYNLKVHQRVHTGDRPYSCTFPNCKRKFAWKASLDSHKLSHWRNATSSSSPNLDNGVTAQAVLEKREEPFQSRPTTSLCTFVPDAELLSKEEALLIRTDDVQDGCLDGVLDDLLKISPHDREDYLTAFFDPLGSSPENAHVLSSPLPEVPNELPEFSTSRSLE